MNGTATDLQTIVTEAASGDATSFHALYEQTVSRVYAYVAHRLPTKEAALDCTQDSFVALHHALPTFTYRSEAEFYGFMFTIVRRTLAKHYRAKQKEVGRVDVPQEQLASPDSNVEQTFAVRQALETLDEITREIVVLHHWSRFTFAEIATLCNMKESAVRVRHHRARASLATLLTS